MFANRLHRLLSLILPEPHQAEKTHGTNLHRIDPLIFYNLFDALKRYDFELWVKLSKDLSISLESLQDLAVEGKLLGPGHLSEVLDALAHHPHYDHIVELAGRNSYSLQSLRDGGMRRQPTGILARDIGERMLPFLGESSLDVELRGRVIVLRITNSIFADGRFSIRSLCGFYTGYLQQLGQELGMRKLDVSETRCACQDADQRICMIHVAT